MKAKNVRVAVVLAAALSAFVLYLCLSITDITPVFIAVLFTAAAAAALTIPAARAFVSVKLSTQKTE